MKKKIFMILATVLAVTLIGITSAFSAGVLSPKAYIETGNIQYPVAKDNIYIYDYRLHTNDYIAAVDATLCYDSDHLRLMYYTTPNIYDPPSTDDNLIYNQYSYNQKINGNNCISSNGLHPGELHFVSATVFNKIGDSIAGGYAFDEDDSILIRAAFFVKGDSGTFDVHTEIKDMCTVKKERLVDNGNIVGEFEHSELITNPLKETPTEVPTEVQTEQPTDTPTEQPTEAQTEQITEAPTETQTVQPTVTPTEQLTEHVTEEPTFEPTEEQIPTEVIPATEYATETALAELIGDTDGDGEITVIDATVIRRYVAEIPTARFDKAAADIDGDGEVTLIDATLIQYYVVNAATSDRIGNLIR